ncbi:MAG: hypothetical protein GYB25_04315 [Rhodobacteraceae bacterium]|nr:hypothetical protein [Paracoccaceae bacterium]
MWTNIKTYLARFRDETRGSVAIEAAIILPMLFWAYIAMFVFFDAYKTRSMTEKAAFTISDMLSRETTAVDSYYLASTRKLFDVLAQSDSASGLRVTVVSYSAITEKHTLEWSKVVGNMEPLLEAKLDEFTPLLPAIAGGESLIVVETLSTYEPALDVGLGDLSIETFIFTRPRFAPQLIWDDGYNGA